MTRDELIEAIEMAEQRFAQLRPRIEAGAEQSLPTGTWRVRDALSHLAARANPVPTVLRRLADMDSGTPAAPRLPIDDSNAEQVNERHDLSITEILDEIQAGHRATLDSIPDDATLVRMLPSANGGESSAAEMIARIGIGHEQNHLNDVLAALRA